MEWALTCVEESLSMSLDIEQREGDGIVILDLEGPLTLGRGEWALLESGNVNIALNFKQDWERPFFGDEQDAVNRFFPDRALKHFELPCPY